MKLNYATAKDMRENLTELLTKDKTVKSRGTIKIDEHTNSLIIYAIRDDIVKILKTIEVIDKPTPQIWIQANIVETTKDVAKNLGIQWGGMFSKHIARRNSLYITPGGTTAGTSLGPTGQMGAYQPAYGAPGLGQQGFGIDFPASGGAAAAAGGIGSLGLIYGLLGGDLLGLQLQALQHESMLRIISSPSITTLDNLKAYSETGNKIPYVFTSTAAGGAATTNVSFIDAVLRLEILRLGQFLVRSGVLAEE
ncbi:MAG: hypothetical protein HQL01_09945 [Nitrospirae bacterium]|nr:hypothetical protein [Nitrospirota bacterium]